MNHATLMDRIYRYQRHIYDLTRPFFLFGRDRLLNRMDVTPGDRVLEVGCGTARNLIRLAARCPEAHYYGVDASGQMLETAERNVCRANLDGQITLRRGMAESLDHASLFGLPEPFDVIFFSYSLSMIADPVCALDAALRNIRPTRAVYAIDFCNQQGWPTWFRGPFARWLSLFHVAMETEVIDHLHHLTRDRPGNFVLEEIYGGYAFLAVFQKP